MADKATKLNQYDWSGTTQDHQKVTGNLSASDQSTARALLRKQGIIDPKVKKKPAEISFGKKKGKKIKPSDIALFTRQLATMIKAGVPLIQALAITESGSDHASVRALVGTIKQDVGDGDTLSEALAKHPVYFDDLFCNLVSAGERSGALQILLDRIALYKEKSESLKKKIKKAMNYPIAVVVIAVIVTAILLIKVVPQFEEIFSGFGAELPAFTQFVIGISRWMQAWWWIVLGMIIALVIVMKQANLRSQKFRDAKDRLLLKAPVIGNIVNTSALARFTRTLSTTFAAGLPLIEALDAVAGAAGNVVYRNATLEIQVQVSEGVRLQKAMKDAGVFPAMAVQMVAIGEESGALDDMLDKVATIFEEDVDTMVDGLTSLMEPLIMSVLGVLVGGLIIAMYMPIFKMGSVV